jgi:hypothetical protein
MVVFAQVENSRLHFVAGLLPSQERRLPDKYFKPETSPKATASVIAGASETAKYSLSKFFYISIYYELKNSC